MKTRRLRERWLNSKLPLRLPVYVCTHFWRIPAIDVTLARNEVKRLEREGIVRLWFASEGRLVEIELVR